MPRPDQGVAFPVPDPVTTFHEDRADETAPLRLLAPVASPFLVAVNFPRSRCWFHPKLFGRLGLVQPGFAVGVNRVSLLLDERRVVLHRSPFDGPVGKTTIQPPLAHSARQRCCTSKLNSPYTIFRPSLEE